MFIIVIEAAKNEHFFCLYFFNSNDRRMALIQMGSTEEATSALIVCVIE